MGKRKSKDGDVAMGGTADDSDDDMSIVNVKFEFFDPQPDHDFHGFKALLRQMLDSDATLFNLSELADLILSQPTIGSTVKVEGNESDPFAFLTVLNLQHHKDKPVIQTLTAYLRRKAASSPHLEKLKELLSQPEIPPIGLIISERLLNVPTQLVPPMYNMLEEELGWARNDNEPYNFTHYLWLTRTYEEVQSMLDVEDDRPRKKKKAGEPTGKETFFFHPEDERLHKHALCAGNFVYDIPQDEGLADSKRAFQEFGIRPQGHCILLDADKFVPAIRDMTEYLGVGS